MIVFNNYLHAHQHLLVPSLALITIYIISYLFYSPEEQKTSFLCILFIGEQNT
jgi:hypothetical protein